MINTVEIRLARSEDYISWRPLWDAYNKIDGWRVDTERWENVSRETWRRIIDPSEPVWALVATDGHKLVAMLTYLYHYSTTRIEKICYLSDLYTLRAYRGRGLARDLLEAGKEQARLAGVRRVYWQSHVSNTGRPVYDQVGQHRGYIVYSVDV
jgi:GNAT superfamily N-acetyltransferase